jgi:hypothetical protein
MQYCYGVGSNFITGAPPEFEDLLMLRLCMKPKYNDPNCGISTQGFTRSDLPNPIHNKTSNAYDKATTSPGSSKFSS